MLRKKRKRSIGLLGSKPIGIDVPTLPPQEVPCRVWERSKGIPHWWDTDDKFVGNTIHPWWTESWGTGDVSYLAKYNGTNWIIGAAPLGAIHGYFTPEKFGSAPSSPYHGISNVPVGGVGNDYIEAIEPYYAFNTGVFQGDKLAVVAYNTRNLIHSFGTPLDQALISTPYFATHYKVYDVDGITLLHDFGEDQIDLSAYDPLSTEYLTPGFYVNPTNNFHLSSIWIVP